MGRLLFEAFDAGPQLFNGVGPAGAATFGITLDEHARVTYSWATDVLKSWNGKESRGALLNAPRQAYDVSAYLLDADDRMARAQLIYAAATAQPFLLALPYEELELTGPGGLTLPTTSTALSDWVNAGQRVVVIALDGRTFVSAVVQSATASSVTVDVDCSAVAKAGARVMPAMAVYLEPQQGFGRQPVGVEEWQLKARAALFGFANVDTMGVGASITTKTLFSVTQTIWDRGIQWDGPTSDSIESLSEIIDYGGVPIAKGAASISDFGRQVRVSGMRGAEFQWWKAFVSAVKGRQKTFLLPTGRADLLFKTKISDTVVQVWGSPTPGAGDPRSIWVASAAHQWAAIRCTDGSTQYVDIDAIGDNGDGTANMSFFSASLGGRTPVSISWAEQVRFESDEFPVEWDGAIFTYVGQARVVQQ